jgi:hypothetical protein
MSVVDSIYGVYLDGCQAFTAARTLFERSQLLTLEENKRRHKERKEGGIQLTI